MVDVCVLLFCSSVLGVVEGGVVQAPPCGVPESGRGLYFNGPGERHALSVPVEGRYVCVCVCVCVCVWLGNEPITL